MKKMIMLTLAVLTLVAPCVALAGGTETDAYRDKFYRVDAGTGTPDTSKFHPTWSGTAWVWKTTLPDTIYKTGLPPAATVIPAGKYLVLGMENLWLPSLPIKYLTVRITYSGSGGPLQFQPPNGAVGFGGNHGPSYGELISETTTGSGPWTYELHYKIRPQPDWEWVMIKNSSSTQSITISEVVWDSNCEYVPSLTAWGILALVLLIAGTALWVMRRRRTMVTA